MICNAKLIFVYHFSPIETEFEVKFKQFYESILNLWNKTQINASIIFIEYFNHHLTNVQKPSIIIRELLIGPSLFHFQLNICKDSHYFIWLLYFNGRSLDPYWNWLIKWGLLIITKFTFQSVFLDEGSKSSKLVGFEEKRQKIGSDPQG